MVQNDKDAQYNLPKVITRYGKIVFSENTAHVLGISDGSYVSLGVDDDFSNACILIPLKDKEGTLQVKKSGDYYYISCTDILKFLGLYSPLSNIFGLIRESETNGEVAYKLSKIVIAKGTPIISIIKNKDEVRSIMAMINAKI